MKLEFVKMHGLGNDFMVVDCITQQYEFHRDVVQRLASRHKGIGFDQLLAEDSSSARRPAITSAAFETTP